MHAALTCGLSRPDADSPLGHALQQSESFHAKIVTCRNKCRPAAGKSLTVHEVVRQCPALAAAAGAPPPLLMSVNCMNLRDPRAVYLHLLGGLTAPSRGGTGSAADSGAEGEGSDSIMRPRPVASGKGTADPVTELRRLMTGAGGGAGKVVAVLDELDQLLSGSNGQARAGASGAPRPSELLLCPSPVRRPFGAINATSRAEDVRKHMLRLAGVVRTAGAAVPAWLAPAAGRHCQLHRPHGAHLVAPSRQGAPMCAISQHQACTCPHKLHPRAACTVCASA